MAPDGSKSRTDEGASRLLSLPAELRNRIWRYAVVFGEVTITVADPHPKTPALVRTCGQARNEAIGIWLLENTFSTTIHNCDGSWTTGTGVEFDSVVATAFRTGAVGDGSQGEYHWKFQLVGGPHWGNLLTWMKPVHGKGYSTLKNGDPSWDPVLKVVMAALSAVAGMKERTWADVEVVLEHLHMGVAASDIAWS
ncbi:hypothetical protein LTR85_005094 [Meristemomyces frigidus]|nr:hypothetical protein LTR85_005094 [Meristemomyces frigidus]